ncbi:MAG: hypothetical protein CMK32_09615 [Porticoccaceae bacterium]|nr:hypothetical protein [Porticoccaceae bacterium]
MQFSDIWNRLCQKQERLNDGDAEVTFKSENLKKLLRQVYDQGESAGRKAGEAKAASNSQQYSDFFSSMFGQ